MVAFKRQSPLTLDADYVLNYATEDVNEICNKEKTVPLEWISEDGSDVTEAFLAYARPLVRGNVLVPTDEDDLPKFAYRK